MPWVNDEYLVDHRKRTLTPLTEELRDEMGRIRSSSRYAIKAVSGEFERLVKEGYRVIQKMGGDLFKNPTGYAPKRDRAGMVDIPAGWKMHPYQFRSRVKGIEFLKSIGAGPGTGIVWRVRGSYNHYYMAAFDPGRVKNPEPSHSEAGQLASALVKDAGLWNTDARDGAVRTATIAFSHGWLTDEHSADVAAMSRAITRLAEKAGKRPRMADLAEAIQYRTLEVLEKMAEGYEQLRDGSYQISDYKGFSAMQDRAKAILKEMTSERRSNPEYTEGPQNWDLRHIHYNSGTEVQAAAKLLRKAGFKADIQINAGYGYGIYKAAKSWTLMTDASNNVVLLVDRFLKRKLQPVDERQWPDEYRLLSGRLGYDLLDKQDQTAGETGRSGVVRGKALNPDYNAFTKSQFDALRQMNKAYPKGDVFLGEIKLKPGERFSGALVAVERLSRATGIDHDVVTYQGKYYSAPTEWVERVVVDTRMEARGKGTRSSSEQRSGGGIRGAVKAGWRELMSNPYAGHRIGQKPKGKKLPHFITMVKDPIGLWFKVDGLGDRRFTNFNEAVAAYHAARKQREMREQAERESEPNRVVYNENAGTLTVYTNGAEMESLPVKDRREARRIFSDHYYDTHNLVFA